MSTLVTSGMLFYNLVLNFPIHTAHILYLIEFLAWESLNLLICNDIFNLLLRECRFIDAVQIINNSSFGIEKPFVYLLELFSLFSLFLSNSWLVTRKKKEEHL